LSVNNSADVGAGQTPAFLIGNRTGHHIGIDNNEIGAFNNNSNAVLHLNGSQSTSNTIINGDGTGNVGIGIVNPGEKLHVNGLIRLNKATSADNNSPGIVLASNDDFLYDGQYLNNYGFGFHGFNDGSNGHTEPANTYMAGYWGIDFFTNRRNRLRISHDGIVSIGTTNRQVEYKLAVNGKILAKEIKVETGWADYVFKKGYDLPTLEEVEQHIKEKGHLPNIPSAEEVAKNGIQLGEMNKLLLEKIEELTLYTIQQQEQLQIQHNSNEKSILEIDKLRKANKIIVTKLQELEDINNKL